MFKKTKVKLILAIAVTDLIAAAIVGGVIYGISVNRKNAVEKMACKAKKAFREIGKKTLA